MDKKNNDSKITSGSDAAHKMAEHYDDVAAVFSVLSKDDKLASAVLSEQRPSGEELEQFSQAARLQADEIRANTKEINDALNNLNKVIDKEYKREFKVLTSDNGIKAVAAALDNQPELLNGVGINPSLYKNYPVEEKVLFIKSLSIAHSFSITRLLLQHGLINDELDLQMFSEEPSEKQKTKSAHAASGLLEAPYAKILQGKGFNALAEVSQKNKWHLDVTTGEALTTIGDVTIIARQLDSLTLNVNTTKLLDLMCILIAQVVNYGNVTIEQKYELLNKGISIKVRDFMEMCGLSDRKEAKKTLIKAAHELFALSIEFDEDEYYIPEGKKKKVKDHVHHKFHIFSAEADSKQRGIVRIFPSQKTVEYLSKAYLMPFAVEACKINSHSFRHAYHFYRKMALHHNINIGRPQANIIGVKTLLAAAPDMPRYEELSEKSRHVTQLMIEPFEKNMDELKRMKLINKWEYCNSKGAPLTDEQIGLASYEVFSGLYIKFEMPENYPAYNKPIGNNTSDKKSLK